MDTLYDTVIILSQQINPDLTLTNESAGRVERGIELYRGDAASTLTMSGGFAQSDIPCSHAAAMKQYAVDKGVNPNVVFMEDSSLDTVGQAVFSKRDVIVLKNWEHLIVVSQQYHLDRVQKIFEFIFGKDFDIKYEGVPSGKARDSEVVAGQQRSLEAFLKTFEGVRAGDDKAILDRLFEKHPLYSNSTRRG